MTVTVWVSSDAPSEHLQTLRRDRLYERLDIKVIRGLTEVEKERLVLLGTLDHMTSGA